MRLVTLIIGFLLGVAATLAYVWLGGAGRVADTRPLASNPPISVTLGEPFLTAIARTVPAQIDGLVVDAEDGVLVIQGNTVVLGQPAIAKAILRPHVRRGELRIDVVHTELGELPVPMEQVIERQINARIRALLADLPVTITGVAVVRDHGMVVTCRVSLSSKTASVVEP